MNRPSTRTGSRRLRGSRPSSLSPKLNSKYSGSQVVVGQLLHPDAEIAAELADLVAPDAIDRRRQLLGVFGRHAIEHAFERLDRAGQLSAP